MDGYTVKEAASILGIPKQRVWELIARGVLAGKSEVSGAMRVFLQPQPPKIAEPSPPVVRPSNGNGNGGGISAHDLGPFRELLTEFRNLTERYGQALLALGEARGEVAALRTRVELLETRMEIRLPSPSSAGVAPSPWESPASEPATAHEPVAADMADGGGAAPEAASAMADSTTAEAPAESLAAEASAHSAPAEAPAESAAEAPTATDGAIASPEAPGAVPRIEPAFEPLSAPPSEAVEPVAAPDVVEPVAEASPEFGRRPRRRRGGSRSAVEGIAQALARADDPTGGSLPGGPETAEALRALRDEMAAAPSRGGSPFLADGEDVMDEPALATAIEVDELLADDQLGGATLEEELELATPREDEPSVAYSPPGSIEEEWVELEAASLEEIEIEPDVAEPAVELVDTLESVAEPAAEAAPEVAEPAVEPEPSVQSVAEPVDALDSGSSEAAAVLTRESPEPTVVIPPGYSTTWEEPDWIAEEDLLEQPVAREPALEGESAELAAPSPPEDLAQPDAETAAAEEGTHDEDARVPAVLPTEELEPAITDWSAWPMASDATDVQAEPAEVAEPTEVAEPAEPAEPAEVAAPMAIEPDVGAAAESDSEPVAEDAPLEPEPEPEPEAGIESTLELEPPAEAESTVEHEPRPQTASAIEPEAAAETQIAPIFEAPMDAERLEPSEGALLEDELHATEGEAPQTGADIDQEATTAPEVAIERAWEPEPAYRFDQPPTPISPPTTAPAPSLPPQEARAQPADFEEELMWLGDEFRSPANSPSATSGPPATGSVAPSSPRPAAGSLPGFEDTLGRMAAERGWEVSEIAAIRALLAGPRHASIGDEPATEQAQRATEQAQRVAEQAEPATVAPSEPEAGIPMEADAEIASVDQLNAEEGEAAGATVALTIDETEKEPAILDREAAGADEMEVAVSSAELEPDDGSPPAGVAEQTHAERASSVWVGPGPLQGLRDAMAAVDEGDELLGWEQSTRYAPPATEQLAGSEPAEGTVGAPEPPLGEEAPQAPAESPAPQPAVAEPDASNQSATERPLPPLSTAQPSGAATSSTQQADWLRGRRGPAADAYRRLRRLFPR